jgi:hypothetical protein
MGIVLRYPAAATLILLLIGLAFICGMGAPASEVLPFAAGGASWTMLYAMLRSRGE